MSPEMEEVEEDVEPGELRLTAFEAEGAVHNLDFAFARLTQCVHGLPRACREREPTSARQGRRGGACDTRP